MTLKQHIRGVIALTTVMYWLHRVNREAPFIAFLLTARGVARALRNARRTYALRA